MDAVNGDSGTRAQRQARARGCLLAAACGDELGAAFEGDPHVDGAALHSWLAASDPVRATDDTVMMRTLAEHLADTLLQGRDLDEGALMDAFVRRFQAEPWRGYGPGTARLFHEVASGKPWQRASTAQFGGAGSLGNGGAMRVAPVGLLPLDADDITSLARRSAAVTHAHPLGMQGAELQAHAVSLASGSEPGETLQRDAFLRELSRRAGEGPYRERLEQLRSLPARATPGDVVACTGNDITALSAVPAAVAAFASHPDVPADVVRFAISMGGDTDTIATMAGAIAGARCGESALPASWLQRLEDPAGLRELAGRLVTGAAGVR